MFPTATVNIFGISNGGQIFTYMFFVVPASAISSALMVSQLETSNIFRLGAFLSFINILILYNFDDGELKLPNNK